MFEHLHYWPRTWIQVACTAFALSAVMMPVAIVLLRRFGIVDAVAANKIHAKPIARGGGVVIFLAFAIAVLMPDYRSHPFNGVIIGAFLCTLVGFVDDLRGGIPAVWKLGTLALVTLILSSYGVMLSLFPWPWLNLVFTMLWLVGVTSAFNGIDNMDGLGSGLAAVIASMFLVIAVQAYLMAGTETSLSWFGMLAAGLIGANLGFLIYNFHPARIFMGDSGSFFLGFTLAALGVMGEWSTTRLISAVIPILILGVPLFDFAYIIIARIRRGQTRTLREIVEHCAPDHLSHRLTWIGFTQRQAVLFIYVIAIAMGVSGVLLRSTSSTADSALALVQGLSVLTIVIVLMAKAGRVHAQYEREDMHKPLQSHDDVESAPAREPSPALADSMRKRRDAARRAATSYHPPA